MQAIITKYLPCTNFRGSRIKASCERGSITVSYDGGLSGDNCHIEAVNRLVAKFVAEDAKVGRYPVGARNPWEAPRVCGCLPSGEYAHVFIVGSGEDLLIRFTSHDDLTTARRTVEKAINTKKPVEGPSAGNLASALSRAVLVS